MKLPDTCNSDESTTQTANLFNACFANVGKNTFVKSRVNVSSHPSHKDPVNNLYVDHLFRAEAIDWQILTLTIAHMNTSDSCRSDGTPLTFLKASLTVVVSHLTFITNTSIVTGIFPTAWKHSAVVPIFKSGNVNDPSNYHPISPLPVLSKILEKIVSFQLTQHLESNNLHIAPGSTYRICCKQSPIASACESLRYLFLIFCCVFNHCSHCVTFVIMNHTS